MSRLTPGSLTEPAACWPSSAAVCRRAGLLGLSLLALITVHRFVDGTVAAQSSVRWIAAPTTASDPVRERMTALIRDHVGRALSLSPPETLSITATRDTLRSTDASQTMFVVTDTIGLNELMANNGWRDMARVGLELVNPRIWGRTIYVFVRGGTVDPRAPLKGWVRWAGPASPEVRNRAAVVARRLGYANVSFETMNVARRMADGLELGGAAGEVEIGRHSLLVRCQRDHRIDRIPLVVEHVAQDEAGAGLRDVGRVLAVWIGHLADDLALGRLHRHGHRDRSVGAVRADGPLAVE